MYRRWDKSKPPKGPFCLNKDSIQAVSLLAWWPFGGAAGRLSVPDMSENGLFNLTGNSTPDLTLNDDGASAGSLSGSNDFSAANNSAFNLQNTTFTCLLKASSFANLYNTVCHRGDASNHFEMYVKSSGKLACYLGATGGNLNYDGSGSNTLSTGVTYGLAMAFTGDTSSILRGYVNGQQDGQATGASKGSLSNTSVFSIGNDTVTAGRRMAGVFSDCRVYSAFLDPAIVNAIWYPGTRYELWYPLRSRRWFSGPAAAGAFKPFFANQLGGFIGVGVS